jgi:hypothetical protein
VLRAPLGSGMCETNPICHAPAFQPNGNCVKQTQFAGPGRRQCIRRMQGDNALRRHYKREPDVRNKANRGEDQVRRILRNKANLLAVEISRYSTVPAFQSYGDCAKQWASADARPTKDHTRTRGLAVLPAGGLEAGHPRHKRTRARCPRHEAAQERPCALWRIAACPGKAARL